MLFFMFLMLFLLVFDQFLIFLNRFLFFQKIDFWIYGSLTLNPRPKDFEFGNLWRLKVLKSLTLRVLKSVTLKGLESLKLMTHFPVGEYEHFAKGSVQ